MANVQIISDKATSYPNAGDYRVLELDSDGQRFVIMAAHARVGKHERRYVSVLCCNASNRTWGKFGREFPDFTAALAGYKSAKAKAAIRFAEELCAAAAPSTDEKTEQPG